MRSLNMTDLLYTQLGAHRRIKVMTIWLLHLPKYLVGDAPCVT